MSTLTINYLRFEVRRSSHRRELEITVDRSGEPHHTPEFWRRVARAMLDYEQRKVWLAGNGMGVEGV